MTRLLLSATFLVSLVGLWWGDPLCSALAGTLVVAVLAIYLYDGAVVSEVSRGVRSRRSQLKNSGGPAEALTSWGRVLLADLYAMHHTIDGMEWELEVNAAFGRARTDRPVAKEPVTPHESEAQLFERALRSISQQTRGSLVGVLFPLGLRREHGGNALFSSVAGRRVEAHLLRAYDLYLEQGDRSFLGRVIGKEESSACEQLGELGVAYNFAIPIEKRSTDGEVSLFALPPLLWVGYPKERYPSELEAARLHESAAQLAEERELFRAVQTLTGKAQAAESENKQKGEFIAQMSHDIRSPLNNIKAILSLLKHERPGAGQGELFEVALHNCESVAEIVEDILDYSRHTVGQLSARRQTFDLHEVVAEAVAAYTVSARMKGLTLDYSAPQFPVCVNADRGHVRRVVMNILSNAVKYTKFGGVRVELVAADPNSWGVQISDSGRGMSADEVTHLFTPFTRFRAEGIEGAGLGLCVTKVLAELSGGEIKVRSEEGRGSAFTAYFQAGEPSPAQTRCSVISDKSFLPTDQMPPQILVVDDERECAETLARSLHGFGIVSLVACTVHDAIGIINFEQPAVVVTDDKMPDGGGRRILEHVAKLGSLVPVVVLSGTEREEGHYRALGASAFFLKPMDPQTLAEEIFALASAKEGQLAAGG